jgi:hypothetical protein
MTFKLQAQAGSRRRSCGVTPRTISGMPSSTERDEWGACTSFGRVLKAADITSVRPGSARCGIAQPCLTLAAVIEGDQRHCNSEAYAMSSDLSRSSTLSGQRSNTDERLGLGIPVGATSRSGDSKAYWPVSAPANTAPHCYRNLGNPCAEKVLQHRPRQNNFQHPRCAWTQGALEVNQSAVCGEHPDDVGAPCQWHSAGAGHKGAASLTKAHGAFRKIGEAVMASEPDACAGVGSPPAGNANHHRLQCASGH